MPRKIVTESETRKKIAALRAKGMSLARIGRCFGVSRQAIHVALRMDQSKRLIRCRVCDRKLNPAGAMPRDDRQVHCLACLAASPDATFGEHLQAYRIAAGLRIVELAKKVAIDPSALTVYERGNATASWRTQHRLFGALGVKLVMQMARD